MTDTPSWILILPHYLAILNATAAILLIGGYLAIRQQARRVHQGFMVSALMVSVVFLVLYSLYHGHVGNVKFAGEGSVRPVYFSLLVSHVVLAAVSFPMILATAWRALQGRWEEHRRLARKTALLWFYVSLSGLVVYAMAFHIYPSAKASTAWTSQSRLNG